MHAILKKTAQKSTYFDSKDVSTDVFKNKYRNR